MYGFENDYDFYPATESNAITEFFSNVWEKIKEFGAKIKEWAGKIKEKIKYLLKTKKEKIEANDKMLKDKVAAVSEDMKKLLGTCGECFVVMEFVMEGLETHKDMSKAETYDDIKDNLDPDTVTKWNKAKAKVISKLTNETETIKRMKENLSEIKHVGMATKGALDEAYKGLTNLYSANTDTGKLWQGVIKFRDACTGEMKSLLGKVVSVYDAVRSAATALMNKLISGKFVDNSDSKLTAKELKSYRKGENEYYIDKEGYKKRNKGYDVREDDKFKKLRGGRLGLNDIDGVSTLKNEFESEIRKKAPNATKKDLASAYATSDVGTAFDFSDFDHDDDISVTEAAAYENGYEQAMQDMAIFNAIPDASEEFDW